MTKTTYQKLIRRKRWLLREIDANLCAIDTPEVYQHFQNLWQDYQSVKEALRHEESMRAHQWLPL